MIDPKYSQLVITLYNVGIIDGIVMTWLKAWLFAFIVALPVINLGVTHCAQTGGHSSKKASWLTQKGRLTPPLLPFQCVKR